MVAKIRETKLRAFDEDGGSIVDLVTDRSTYNLELRAFNQSDANAVFPRVPDPEVPSNVVAHVTNLDTAKVQELHSSPTTTAQNALGTLLDRARKLHPNALILEVGHPEDGAQTTERTDPRLIDVAAGEGADAVALPGFIHESVDSMWRRLVAAKAYAERLPEEIRPTIVPSIRLDNKNCLLAFGRLVDAEVPVVALDVRIKSASVFGNLGAIHGVLRKAAVPPYLIGTDVPRHFTQHMGSANLMAAKFGVQVCVPHVSGRFPRRPPSNPKAALERMDWFSRPDGGHWPAQIRPANFGRQCSCPPHQHARGDLIDTLDFYDAYYVRRIHDTWAHLEDRGDLARAIAKTRFIEEYLDRRPLLRNSARSRLL